MQVISPEPLPECVTPSPPPRPLPTGATDPAATTHAITMRGALYSWAILAGIKTVENRPFRLSPGWYGLHTGLGSLNAETRKRLEARLARLPPAADLPPAGAIAGLIRVDGVASAEGCAGTAAEPWATGPVRHVIGAVLALPSPVPHRGLPGLSPLSDATRLALREQIEPQPPASPPRVAHTDPLLLPPFEAAASRPRKRRCPAAGPAAKGARRRLDWPEAGEAMSEEDAAGVARAFRFRFNFMPREQIFRSEAGSAGGGGGGGGGGGDGDGGDGGGSDGGSGGGDGSCSSRSGSGDGGGDGGSSSGGNGGGSSGVGDGVGGAAGGGGGGGGDSSSALVGGAALARYESARRHLSGADLRLFCFEAQHEFLSLPEEAQLLAWCDSLDEWEPRVGSVDGGVRRCFGVTLGESYRVLRSEPLPPVLAALGEKVLAHVRGRPWPFACLDPVEQPPFGQCYVQRYIGGQSLGFHFDHRREYDEMIAGVSVGAPATLLLGATSGAGGVREGAARAPNVQRVHLPPRSLYVMGGMARYDLRHAVEAHPAAAPHRYSFTFRSLGCRRGAC